MRNQPTREKKKMMTTRVICNTLNSFFFFPFSSFLSSFLKSQLNYTSVTIVLNCARNQYVAVTGLAEISFVTGFSLEKIPISVRGGGWK